MVWRVLHALICSSASSLVASSLASLAAHGFILVWGGWVLVCYIEGVTKLDILAASLLVSVTDSLPWVLSLLLKSCLYLTLVMGWGQDVDGGWNPS